MSSRNESQILCAQSPNNTALLLPSIFFYKYTFFYDFPYQFRSTHVANRDEQQYKINHYKQTAQTVSESEIKAKTEDQALSKRKKKLGHMRCLLHVHH